MEESSSKQQYKLLIQKGEQTLLEGKFSEALAHFYQAKTIAPEEPEIYKNIGNIYLAQKNFDAAETNYKEALSINSEYWPAYHNMGTIAKEKGNLENAKNYFIKALSYSPREFIIHNSLANLYGDMKDYTNAHSHFAQALELIPNDASIKYNIGKTYLEEGRAEDAIKQFNNLLENADISNFPDIYYSLSLALLLTGDLISATSNMQKFVNLCPDNYWGYSKLGELHFSQKEYELSANYYEKALKLYPYDIDLWQALSKAYIKSEEILAAQECLKRALRFNPNNHSIVTDMARLYFEERKHDQLLALLDQELKIDPSNWEFHYLKGCSFYDLEDFENALSSFQQASTLSNDLPLCSKAITDTYNRMNK